MKKSYLNWSRLSLISALVLSSCMSEVESPVANELAKTTEESAEVSTGGENLRKSAAAYNYSESFSNQLFEVDYVGENPFGISYFPGSGVGMANRMGKASSFLNQLALFDPASGGVITVNAPVTQFFSDELEALGLTNIPDEVSSLTTDGKGNAIWFKNIKNVTTPVSPTLTNFEAEVEVIGGNGRFSKARGQGVVRGTFNPTNGKGSSVLEARIDY
jgi:hypothetical protein